MKEEYEGLRRVNWLILATTVSWMCCSWEQSFHLIVVLLRRAV